MKERWASSDSDEQAKKPPVSPSGAGPKKKAQRRGIRRDGDEGRGTAMTEIVTDILRRFFTSWKSAGHPDVERRNDGCTAQMVRRVGTAQHRVVFICGMCKILACASCRCGEKWESAEKEDLRPPTL